MVWVSVKAIYVAHPWHYIVIDFIRIYYEFISWHLPNFVIKSFLPTYRRWHIFQNATLSCLNRPTDIHILNFLTDNLKYLHLSHLNIFVKADVEIPCAWISWALFQCMKKHEVKHQQKTIQIRKTMGRIKNGGSTALRRFDEPFLILQSANPKAPERTMNAIRWTYSQDGSSTMTEWLFTWILMIEWIFTIDVSKIICILLYRTCRVWGSNNSENRECEEKTKQQ